MNREYLEFCEWLWDEWRERRLEVPDGFDNALPEPYLTFDVEEEHENPPLLVLTYNPGGVLAFQENPESLWIALAGVINGGRDARGPAENLSQVSYADLSGALAKNYLEILLRENYWPAHRRIEQMKALARSLECNGVIQIECCPFHSARFPMKRKIDWISDPHRQAVEYRNQLAQCIQEAPGPVIAISASGPLAEEMVLNRWLDWQAGMLGIQRGNRRFVPIGFKGASVTTAALVNAPNGGNSRTLLLRRGNNSLPADEGLQDLANAMRPLPRE